MRRIRIFVSSPGDCVDERRVLDEVVDRINKSDGDRAGFFLQAITWEGDVVPRIGPPPQTVVDDQTPICEIYLGIMSARFGGDGTRESGTEHEFRQALERFGNTGQPWILFYFNERPPLPTTLEAVDQWKSVLQFRKDLETKGIVGTYAGVRGSANRFFEMVDLHPRVERAVSLGPLTSQGWSVFWDRRIPPGRTFEDYIEERLRGKQPS